MAARKIFLLAFGITIFCFVPAISGASVCNVNAQTDAGKICGLRRKAENGAEYASFRGIPYAKQPVGELRFKELQPAEPWTKVLETVEEGPVCPQLNTLFGPLMATRPMAEECILANVHVPIHALPGQGRKKNRKANLPILVFIHGGGFSSGSGDSDLNGPEYLVGKDVIVITFNYRLNVFGFLSLNSASIPGNNGLRDQITLLRWVQKNARAFGGNPDDVTLMGQSAGAASVHLLSLSNAAEGLFNRVILLSGEADRSFFTASPGYSVDLSNKFLQALGINSTDPEDIHNQLVKLPLDQIMKANEQLQTPSFLAVFAPVVESEFPGVTRVLDDMPSALIEQGRGADLPLLIGVTNNECESVRIRYQTIDILQQIKDDPYTILTFDMQYTLPTDVANEEVELIRAKFLPTGTLDEVVSYCTKSIFENAAFSLAQRRAELGSPAYLYQFAYRGVNSTLKSTFNVDFEGAGHIEDMTYILRPNGRLGSRVSIPPQNDDDRMVELMSSFIINFVKCSDPSCGDSDGTTWPLADEDDLIHHYIESPSSHYSRPITDDQRQNVLDYFNEIYDQAS